MYHWIQIAVRDMTLSGWKLTLSLIHPPPSTPLAELSRCLSTTNLLGVDRSAKRKRVQSNSTHIQTHTPRYTTESKLQSVIWPRVVESRYALTTYPHPAPPTEEALADQAITPLIILRGIKENAKITNINKLSKILNWKKTNRSIYGIRKV